MSQDPKIKKGVWVGVFISTGVLLIILSFQWAKTQFSFWETGWVVHTELPQASGLKQGSTVTINGISVGYVEALALSPESIQKVRVSMRLQDSLKSKIPSDSRVSLRTQGALGDRYVEIVPGHAKDVVPESGLITAEPDQDLFDLVKDKVNKADDIFSLAQEAAQLIKQTHRDQRIPEILKETHLLLKDLRALTNSMQKTLNQFNDQERREIQSVLQDIKNITSSIKNGSGTLGLLVQDPELYNSINQLLGGGREKQQLQQLLQQYEMFQKKKQRAGTD